MLNLVISLWVTLIKFDLDCCRNKGITEPLLPITFPYLTTLNFIFLLPIKLFAAINNLSEANLVAPYKFIGAAALSVLKAKTFSTLELRAASIILCS